MDMCGDLNNLIRKDKTLGESFSGGFRGKEMSKVAILTDTNSGMTMADAEEQGIFLLPMPFMIDGSFYQDQVDLTQELFYEKMESGADVSTSQPSPGNTTACWDEILETYDALVYIPMSSGLSQTCETALVLAQDYNGRVEVANIRRISVTQRQAAIEAKALADQGFSARKIREILEREGSNSSIYITVDTLKYLKKGGRVTAAGAALGTVLNLKPVLQIQGGKLDAKAKARGMKKARQIMLQAVREDCETRFREAYEEGNVQIQVAYTKGPQAVIDSWVQEVAEAFPGMEIHADPLSLSIACHIGPGALAVTASQVTKELQK